jgi:hypothetical protein
MSSNSSSTDSDDSNNSNNSNDLEKEEELEEEIEEELELNEMNSDLCDAIKETFTNELKKIFTKIASKYGDEYLFDENDLLDFVEEHQLKLYYKKSSSKQKLNKKFKNGCNQIPDNQRCWARIWAGGYMDENQYGDRCNRRKIENTDFCRQHNQELVHGRFDKEPSKIVKGFYLKEKYS